MQRANVDAEAAPRREIDASTDPGRLPHVDPKRCTGRGRCVAACEPRLLSLEVVRWKKYSVLHDADRCTSCNACAVICPFHAITMRTPRRGQASSTSANMTLSMS